MTGRLAASAGVLLLAALAGAAAALATAATAGDVALMLAIGGLAEALTATAGLALVWRRRWTVAAGVAGVAVALSAAAVTVPLPDHGTPPPVVPGQSRWQLASGSSIRYVRLAARAPVRPVPVVFLHGGPGVPDLAGNAAYFGRLTADGFDVYLYDELGAGGSTRLTDPRGYTVERDVTDLELIRRRIGADRVILIGHSYGAILAAHYLAAHPDRVARAVVISPGPLDPADHSGDRAKSGLSLRDTVGTYAATLAPRALLGYTLLQVDPRTAHRYLGDREADARNDVVLRRSAAARHCPGRAAEPVSGTGFYRLQYPQSATAGPVRDVRPALAGNRTPVLVLKGSCDYLSWRSALGWTTTLTGARLVYLHDAGHNLFQDQPAAALASIRSFLLDRPPPVAPYRSAAAPADYRRP